MKISIVRDFAKEKDDDSSVVRVNNKYLFDLGGRYAWIKIKSPTSSIFRRVQGVSILENAIELDRHSRLKLGITGDPNKRGFRACELELLQVSYLENLKAEWQNPVIKQRTSFQLAVISATVAAIGFIVGIISLLK